MNLENLDIHELNGTEIKQIDGGSHYSAYMTESTINGLSNGDTYDCWASFFGGVLKGLGIY